MKYCPVCNNPAGRGTFKCVGGCPEETWVHPKCGGYGNREIQSVDPRTLVCNNCRKVFIFFDPSINNAESNPMLVVLGTKDIRGFTGDVKLKNDKNDMNVATTLVL